MTVDPFMALSLGEPYLSDFLAKEEVTNEQLDEAREEREKLIAEIEAEWTPERITRWRYERERETYAFYKRRRAEVEIENKEARIRGMSYQDRQKFSRQLEALDRLLTKSNFRGLALAHDLKTGFHNAQARLFIDPLDVEFIHRRGFETHLRYATM